MKNNLFSFYDAPRVLLLAAVAVWQSTWGLVVKKSIIICKDFKI